MAMGPLRRKAGLLAASVAVFAACGDLIRPVTPLDARPASAEADEFMTMVNSHRASVGCGPLAWHGAAAEAAKLHSEDMASRGYFDHVSPDGRTLADRLSAAGISYAYAGENIAAGQRSVEDVFVAWLGSPPHRRSIEACEFTHHGLGREGTHWTLVMLVPR